MMTRRETAINKSKEGDAWRAKYEEREMKELAKRQLLRPEFATNCPLAGHHGPHDRDQEVTESGEFARSVKTQLTKL